MVTQHCQYKFWSVEMWMWPQQSFIPLDSQGKIIWCMFLFIRNRLQHLCWIAVRSAELLLFLYSSWWDNTPAGKTCFYCFCFHFLLPSPPHSVFSLIASFLRISFSTYFHFLPPLGLGGTSHVPLVSHISPVQAPSSKFSAIEQFGKSS